MGWIKISDWLKIPHLEIWHKSCRDEYTTLGEDARRLTWGVSREILIKHHDGDCVSDYSSWDVDEDNFSVVSLGGEKLTAGTYHLMDKNIRDFIRFVHEMTQVHPIPDGSVPCDVKVFEEISKRSLTALNNVNYNAFNAFHTYREIGFWIFNAPAFFVEGERAMFIERIWKAKNSYNLDLIMSLKHLRIEGIKDWVAMVTDRDEELLRRIPNSEEYPTASQDGVHRYERGCHGYLDNMARGKSDLYLQDMFPKAIPMLYDALFNGNLCDPSDAIRKLRGISKPFSWGGT